MVTCSPEWLVSVRVSRACNFWPPPPDLQRTWKESRSSHGMPPPLLPRTLTARSLFTPPISVIGGVNRFAVVAEGDRPGDTRRRSRDWQGPEGGGVWQRIGERIGGSAKGKAGTTIALPSGDAFGRGEVLSRDAMNFRRFSPLQISDEEIGIGVKDIDRPIRRDARSDEGAAGEAKGQKPSHAIRPDCSRRGCQSHAPEHRR